MIARVDASSAAPRQVAILAYPQVQSLDITGPLEVFAGAQRLIAAESRDARGYEIRIISRDEAPLRTSSGMQIVPHGILSDAPQPLDTLIVAGGAGCEQAAADPVLIEWLARNARTARRTAGVCTGAFLLARAGLLEGRRAQGRATARIADQGGDLLGPVGRIARPGEHAGRAHDFRLRGVIRGHDGCAALHRLQHGQTEPLV